jgi:hypothetical protein
MCGTWEDGSDGDARDPGRGASGTALAAKRRKTILRITSRAVAADGQPQRLIDDDLATLRTQLLAAEQACEADPIVRPVPVGSLSAEVLGPRTKPLVCRQ